MIADVNYTLPDDAIFDMGDTFWTEIAQFLYSYPSKNKETLLPAGAWNIDCQNLSYYQYDKTVSSTSNYELYVLNKATISVFPQSLVSRILRTRHYVFGNPVFCVFASENVGLEGDPAHIAPLRAYVEPKRLWREKPWRCNFIHIPKAAGTSVWRSIASQIPSNIYFQSNEALRAFDGDINDFELVGGHITAETLRLSGRTGHHFTALRDPTERVLSFIAHARRLEHYRGHLDPSFLLARQNQETLSDEGRAMILREANFQIAILGLNDARELKDASSVAKGLSNALALFNSPDWTIGLLSKPDRLAQHVATAFRVDVHHLPTLNTAKDDDGVPGSIASTVRALLDGPSCLSGDRMLVQIAAEIEANLIL